LSFKNSETVLELGLQAINEFQMITASLQKIKRGSRNHMVQGISQKTEASFC
jgi:hypothetical protein